jgi:hypothetical protein
MFFGFPLRSKAASNMFFGFPLRSKAASELRANGPHYRS